MNTYLDCQELDDHCKHTKHQGNQKNEDPNDVRIYVLYKHIQVTYLHTLLFINLSMILSTSAFPYVDTIKL